MAMESGGNTKLSEYWDKSIKNTLIIIKETYFSESLYICFYKKLKKLFFSHKLHCTTWKIAFR